MGFCANLLSRCVGWLAVVCALSEIEEEWGNRLSREQAHEYYLFSVLR